MTHAEAMAVATREAQAGGHPVDVWEHTGDAKHPAQGRFVTRQTDSAAPRHGRWTKVAVVDPDSRGEPAPASTVRLERRALILTGPDTEWADFLIIQRGSRGDRSVRLGDIFREQPHGR